MTVARVSGDAFGLFGTEDALDPARVLALFARPFQVDDYELQVSTSLGLVMLTELPLTCTIGRESLLR